MAIDRRAITIGLTAPFGSGCTTAAEMLVERHGFKHVKLSDYIRREWKELHPNLDPTRADLQQFGNQLRKDSKSSGFLAELAVEELRNDTHQHQLIAIDGIRNIGEIDVFRDAVGRGFYLFALECPASDRWERLRPLYERNGRSMQDFHLDDKHDRDEEYAFGQQVQLCVDQADVLLSNRDADGLAELRRKLAEYVELVSGREVRFASPKEIFMNLAYSASHASKCVKRQVGALIVNAKIGEMGEIVGQGFNENPAPTAACVEEPTYGYDPSKKTPGRCYRDIVRLESLEELISLGRRCPNCGHALVRPKEGIPRWKCATCSAGLEDFFWPERAMTLCTAIHAEVAAIFAAGRRTKGATLYTTTLPCFQCSEKIIQAGIKYIVFNEPYPDIRAATRLKLARIEVEVFEGVRSRRFDEIFSQIRKAL